MAREYAEAAQISVDITELDLPVNFFTNTFRQKLVQLPGHPDWLFYSGGGGLGITSEIFSGIVSDNKRRFVRIDFNYPSQTFVVRYRMKDGLGTVSAFTNLSYVDFEVELKDILQKAVERTLLMDRTQKQ